MLENRLSTFDSPRREDARKWALRPPSGAEIIDTGAARWWAEGPRTVCNQSYTTKVTPDNLRAGFQACGDLSEDLPIVLIAESGPLAETTREARLLLAGSEAAAVYGAMAVVVSSPVAAVIMRFFVRFARPPFTVQVFSSAEAARGWAAEEVDRMLTRERVAQELAEE